ncbi:MAG: hypothetical protein A3K77_00630 [Euryarchaeota archaeon RBG_13_31_8]|nr:MAG: hypothetical protein A3K77_00630 [Euryarchaeota archaeon RBG_13_31_8]
MKISICCPTRNRPLQMQRLWDSIKNTVYDINEIELIFYIDNDDINSINQLRLMKSCNVRAYIGKQKKISEMWNDCYNIGIGEVFMVCADDIVFSSNHWDKLVRDEFDKWSDKIILVYGRDGGKNERLATHPFIHKNWIETIGYFTPPYFSFCMCDKWLDEIARELNRRIFINEIYTAHWNCTNREFTSGQPDKTWIEMQGKGVMENYRGIYHSRGKERFEQIEKLKNFIVTFNNKK